MMMGGGDNMDIMDFEEIGMLAGGGGEGEGQEKLMVDSEFFNNFPDDFDDDDLE